MALKSRANKAPFTWRERRDDDDLWHINTLGRGEITHIVIDRFGDAYSYTYSEERAKARVEELNTQAAHFIMTEGTDQQTS